MCLSGALRCYAVGFCRSASIRQGEVMSSRVTEAHSALEVRERGGMMQTGPPCASPASSSFAAASTPEGSPVPHAKCQVAVDATAAAKSAPAQPVLVQKSGEQVCEWEDLEGGWAGDVIQVCTLNA
jgi:hypothetical protein